MCEESHDCLAWGPLTEAFSAHWAALSALDDVFTENDALSPEKRQAGMGRLYRAWKDWRVAVDPDFDPERYSADSRPSPVRQVPGRAQGALLRATGRRPSRDR